MKELFIGIDSSWKLHCLLILDDAGNEIRYDEASTRACKLVQLRDYLLTLCDHPENVHIAIEDPKQPIVDVLLEAGFSMWSINPKQTHNLRQVRWTANVKDDRRDALVIAEELRLRKHLFTRIKPVNALTTSLQLLHRYREDLVATRNAEENRLTQHLRRFFPQYLELGWMTQERVMIDLLLIAPHPGQLNTVSLEDVRIALGRTKKHTPEQVLAILKNSPLPLHDDLLDNSSSLIKMHARTLRFHNACIKEIEQEIEQVLAKMDEQGRAEDTPSDVQILRSIPGIGNYILATLLSEGGAEIEDRDHKKLRLKSIAPITSRTGNQGRKSAKNKNALAPVYRRFHGNRELQTAFYHLGRTATQNNPYYKTRYQKMRQRGHTHGRACRQIADQLLTVMFAMLRNKAVYNPDLHGATLRKAS